MDLKLWNRPKLPHWGALWDPFVWCKRSLFRMCNPWGLLSCLAGDINSPPAVWLGQWAEKYRTTIKEKRSMVPMVALQLYHEECVGDVRFKHTVTGFWCKKRMQQQKKCCTVPSVQLPQTWVRAINRPTGSNIIIHFAHGALDILTLHDLSRISHPIIQLKTWLRHDGGGRAEGTGEPWTCTPYKSLQ